MAIQDTIKFEEDYFFRNNRTITSSPDIALTELVANAWDAGAKKVSITIPEDDGTELVILDDGCGMSELEFSERWMTLNYNRTKHQGKYVSFPVDAGEAIKKRIAYGRNGVGRHGMLCFSDRYSVETWKDGICHTYVIAVSTGGEPFKIISQDEKEKDGHGTCIKCFVSRNRPDVSKMRDILAARFIYDPQFTLLINNKVLDLASCESFIKQEEITTKMGKKLCVNIIDSTKTSLNSHQHGVAFWICGRLVGDPAWTYGSYQFLDARYRVAKRYTIIVQSEDLIDEVLPDWTAFYNSTVMDDVYSSIKNIVTNLVTDVMKSQIEIVKEEVIDERREDIKELHLAEQRELSTFIEVITENNPMVAPEILKTSVDAMLKIQKAKKGQELLTQISNLSIEEMDKLSDLLRTWDINDVVDVIDEIDKRIVVVEAISRIYENRDTDELHTLHPMVLQAKWLFGAEFDSPMFTSNRSLSTIIKTLFKDDEYDLSEITNPRKRPDIVCLNRSTLRAVCTERADVDAGGIMKPDQILIVELKRGGFEIGADEVGQAENYVRQIKKSGQLHKAAEIHAFVVGCAIGDVDPHKSSDSGRVDVVTYGQLVETAKVKLFGLKERLEEHYKSFDEQSLVEKALAQPEQIKLNLNP